MNKKILYTNIVLLFCIIIGCTHISASASSSINYSIDQYSINAVLYANGGMDVTEFLDYNFDDTANGIYRDIEYINPSNTKYSGTGISDIKVFSANENQNTLKEFKLSKTTLEDGVDGLYTMDKSDYGVKLKIYSPADNNHKYYIIKYHIADAIVRYNDTADFNWRFIGDQWESSLNNVRIRVSIPTRSDKLRFFSHGPLNGHNYFINHKTVIYTNSGIDSETSVSLRLLFPRNIVSDVSSMKTINRNNLSLVLKEEALAAKKANIRRSHYDWSVALAIIWPILSILLYVIIYKKYGTRPKQGVGIIKTAPDNYGPAFTEYVNYYNTVEAKGITAELMNFVRKKYATIEEELTTETKKTKNDSRITLVSDFINYDYDYEKYLSDWFFKKIGDGKSVTYSQIKTYSTKNSKEFNKDLVTFRKTLKKEALANNFITQKTTAYINMLLFTVFSITVSILLATKYYMYEFAISASLSSLVFMLLSFAIKRPTPELALYKEKWNSYRKYIKQFSSTKNNSNIDVDGFDLQYWEQTLMFMIVFGDYKRGVKFIETRYPADSFADNNLTYLHHDGGGFGGLNGFSSSVSSSISSFSSTTGFSSGGSSSGAAGGGGGGGGAF